MYIRIGILVTIILVNAIVFSRMVWGPTGLLEYYALKEKHQALQAQIETLDAKNLALSNEIRLLQTDKRYVEQVIRQHLHFIKNNELLYLFGPNHSKLLGADVNVGKN